MKSTIRRHGTQQQRRDLARTRLLDATIDLIGRQGIAGFSIAEVEARAGVGRALVGYHFKSRRALLQSATQSLAEEDASPGERGLEPMFEWMELQLRRAASRDGRALATLQIAIGPGADAEVMKLRGDYWRRQTDHLQQHLAGARVLHQLRDGVEPREAAPILLGQLIGEQLRIISTGQPASPAFRELLRLALTPASTSSRADRKARTSQREQPRQSGLFDQC